MKRLLLLVVLLMVAKSDVFATHVRAGEFSYTWLYGNTFQVQIRTYTEITYPSSLADQDRLPLTWGDMSPVDTIFRVAVETIAAGYAENTQYLIQKNVYQGIHTYPGFGRFGIGLQDVNRDEGILNIDFGNSDETPLFVSDTLFFLDPSIYGPPNSSPILPSYAVDFGYMYKVFHHYPAAFDPNGDSLHFEIYTPLDQPGANVPLWVYPNMVAPVVSGTTFTIDPLNGDITWTTPQYQGWYNVGIRIVEYRKLLTNGGSPRYFQVGSEMRDLQIIILPPVQNPPPVVIVHDTCIIAGTTFSELVRATDATAGENITISMDGGPFEVAESPATYVQTSTGNSESQARFTWQTVCDHSAPGNYQVLVRATNNYDQGPQTTTALWNIKVVAPPPQDLTATVVQNSIVLNWQHPYACDSVNSKWFIGFSIWRKIGCDTLPDDTCTPGLLGRGYTEIASRVHAFTYTDNTVQIGNVYGYRVLAEFSDTSALGYMTLYAQSLASNGACAALKKDLPVITKISVDSTSHPSLKNGSMQVAWSNPNPLLLDTVQHPPPYTYKLYRSPGYTNASDSLVKTFVAPTFKSLDSTYTDTMLYTRDTAYSYTVQFYSDTTKLGQTQNASSIFLRMYAANRQLILDWTEDVPWTNDTFYVYRINNNDPQNPILVGDTTAQTFIVRGLKNDSTYCFRIKSIGHYSVTGIPEPITNWSQEDCGVPIDTVGPCPPGLVVNNECNTIVYNQGPFTDSLTWNKPPFLCGSEVLKYYIYYAPTATSAFALIDSSHYLNDTTFTYNLLNTVAGCFAVAAVDSNYKRGHLGTPICVDNCPEYKLPNTFTPNGDGSNDFFVPLTPYRFIEKVEMKIYTSWGSLVFQTTDPAINWDGKIASTGKQAPDGTYYYVCEVFDETSTATNKPSNTLSGFIHLFR